MNLIVSDFDGTIKRFDENPNILKKIDFKKDIKEIDKFIELGNKFVISTKRATSSILTELKKFGVNYSYLTVYEGLVSFDSEGKLLYANYLEKNFINFMTNLFNSSNLIESIDFYNAYGEKNLSKEEYILIGIKVRNIQTLMIELQKIKKDIGDLEYSYSFSSKKIWIHKTTNKSIGIKKLLETTKEKDDFSKIITVGDSWHDISMIKDYNGYCIENGEIDIYNPGNIKRTKNIRSLIRTIR